MYKELFEDINEFIAFYYDNLRDMIRYDCENILEIKKSEREQIREKRKELKDEATEEYNKFVFANLKEAYENGQIEIDKHDDDVYMNREIINFKNGEDSIIRLLNPVGMKILDKILKKHEETIDYFNDLNKENFGHYTNYNLADDDIETILQNENLPGTTNLIIEEYYDSDESKFESYYFDSLQRELSDEYKLEKKLIIEGAKSFIDGILCENMNGLYNKIEDIIQEYNRLCDYKEYGDEAKEEYMNDKGYQYDDVMDEYIDENEIYKLNIYREKRHLKNIYGD